MDQAAPMPLNNPAECLILIVDDDADIRLLVEIALQKEGFRTSTATDGRDAFSKLEAGAPDLIFLDLMMPGQSGYEFLRGLQGTPYASIPVVIATARALDKSTVAVIRQESNVVDFFTKPFKWPLILSAIHKRLNTPRAFEAPKKRL
jgi:two-component system OmpR family response regulator